jgi:hypothetical protein
MAVIIPKIITTIDFVSSSFLKRKLNQIKLNLFSHIGITIEKNKAIQKFDENLINYLIQTESDKFKNRFNELFTGIDSLPNQIQNVKNNDDYKNNVIVKNLIPILSKKIGTNIEREQVIDNLKLFLSQLTTGESNSLSEAFEELKGIDEELYNDLVIFNIFQSGISNGIYQYAKIIPYLAQKNVLEALVSLDPKSITDAKLADFTVKFMLSNSFNQKLNKKNVGKYIRKLKEEELDDDVASILSDIGGVENEMLEEFDNYSDVISEVSSDDINDDSLEATYNVGEDSNPFKTFETFKYNGKVKLVNTETEDIVNPIGGYDGMDYTQDISNFKELVNEIKKEITILGNKTTTVVKQTKSTETTYTQPSTSVKAKGFKLSIDKKGKDQGKADLANRFIGYGVSGTSTYQYQQDAKKAGIPLNYEGVIDESTVAFVSVNGNNKATKNAIYETIENAREILENGGTVVMDSTSDANRSWNQNGEALVQEQLGAPTGQTFKGYNYWGNNPEITTQPAISESTQSDTFYNLEDFTNEQKVSILNTMIAKRDADSKEDALNQLNQMLATDKEFATEYIKSCLS